MMLHNLRQISYLYPIGNGNLTGSWALKSTNKLQNSGFSSSILTHKTNLITLAYMKIDFVKQGETAIGHCQIID